MPSCPFARPLPVSRTEHFRAENAMDGFSRGQYKIAVLREKDDDEEEVKESLKLHTTMYQAGHDDCGDVMHAHCKIYSTQHPHKHTDEKEKESK